MPDLLLPHNTKNGTLAMPCTEWSKEDWAKVEVLLKCGTGKDASTKQELQVGVVHEEIAIKSTTFKN